MAQLIGVKTIVESIEYNGVVYEKNDEPAVVGNIIRVGAGEAEWFTEGGYYEVVFVDSDGSPFVKDDDCDTMPVWCGENNTVFKRKATDEEVAEAKDALKPKVSVGDYVRITEDQMNWPTGTIVKVTHVRECGNVIDATDGRDTYGSNKFEVLSADEAKVFEKWAAIGRKVNEYKVGDIVDCVGSARGETGKGEVIGVIKPLQTYRVLYANPRYGKCSEPVEIIALVSPVEQRFDKAEVSDEVTPDAV